MDVADLYDNGIKLARSLMEQDKFLEARTVTLLMDSFFSSSPDYHDLLKGVSELDVEIFAAMDNGRPD